MVETATGQIADRDQAQGYVSDAVRQGITLARLEFRKMDEEAIDERIDRKIDKVKVWLFGVVIANLLPVIAFAYMFGQFTASVNGQLVALNEAKRGGVTQEQLQTYATETNRRVSRLEAAHGLE